MEKLTKEQKTRFIEKLKRQRLGSMFPSYFASYTITGDKDGIEKLENECEERLNGEISRRIREKYPIIKEISKPEVRLVFSKQGFKITHYLRYPTKYPKIHEYLIPRFELDISPILSRTGKEILYSSSWSNKGDVLAALEGLVEVDDSLEALMIEIETKLSESLSKYECLVKSIERYSTYRQILDYITTEDKLLEFFQSTNYLEVQAGEGLLSDSPLKDDLKIVDLIFQRH